eukprot:98842_1
MAKDEHRFRIKALETLLNYLKFGERNKVGDESVANESLGDFQIATSSSSKVPKNIGSRNTANSSPRNTESDRPGIRPVLLHEHLLLLVDSLVIIQRERKNLNIRLDEEVKSKSNIAQQCEAFRSQIDIKSSENQMVLIKNVKYLAEIASLQDQVSELQKSKKQTVDSVAQQQLVESCRSEVRRKSEIISAQERKIVMAREQIESLEQQLKALSQSQSQNFDAMTQSPPHPSTNEPSSTPDTNVKSVPESPIANPNPASTSPNHSRISPGELDVSLEHRIYSSSTDKSSDSLSSPSNTSSTVSRPSEGPKETDINKLISGSLCSNSQIAKDARISELEFQLCTERDRFQTEIEPLRTRVIELTRELSEQEAKATRYLLEMNEKLNRGDLDDSERAADIRVTELDLQARTERDILETAIETLRARLIASKRELSEQETKTTGYLLEMNEKLSEKSAELKESSEINLEIKARQIELKKRHHARVIALKRELSEQKRELSEQESKATDDLIDINARLEEKRTQLEKSSQINSEIMAGKIELKQENQKLRERITNMENEKSALESEIERLRRRLLQFNARVVSEESSSPSRKRGRPRKSRSSNAHQRESEDDSDSDSQSSENSNESRNSKKRVRPANSDESQETHYQVESIEKRCINGIDGEVQYLVKWVGWDEPTWEPEGNLVNCDDALEKFRKKKRRHKN